MLILVFMIYISVVTFVDLPATGNEHAKTVLPFLLGVIATLIGFYWGNSSKLNMTTEPPGTVTNVDTKTETRTESKTDKTEPVKA